MKILKSADFYAVLDKNGSSTLQNADFVDFEMIRRCSIAMRVVPKSAEDSCVMFYKERLLLLACFLLYHFEPTPQQVTEREMTRMASREPTKPPGRMSWQSGDTLLMSPQAEQKFGETQIPGPHPLSQIGWLHMELVPAGPYPAAHPLAQYPVVTSHTRSAAPKVCPSRSQYPHMLLQSAPHLSDAHAAGASVACTVVELSAAQENPITARTVIV